MRFLCPNCRNIISVEHPEATADCPSCHAANVVPAKLRDKNAIIGDFVLDKIIGRGGMGVVYLARQISPSRPAALKILLDKYADNSEFVVGFLLEARAAAGLKHPNIVQAYAVGEEDGVFYFSMEYIDGRSAKSELKDRGKIPPKEVVKWVRDIANALDFAWREKRIVHHDIKPDNILLDSSGNAKLADLGLARIAGAPGGLECDSENVLGTPQYISPEQLMGELCDNRSDIYSLGATFYHLLTGKYPFVGENANETAQMHVLTRLTSPQEIDSSVPLVLSDIIVKMMSKKPDERYSSTQEVVKQLDLYLESINPKVATVAPPKSTAKCWFWILSIVLIGLIGSGFLMIKAAQKVTSEQDNSGRLNKSATKEVRSLTYLDGIEEVTVFFRSNPYKEEEFLIKVDAFLANHPEPQNPQEREIASAILDAYGRIDERLRVNPVRARLEETHQKAIAERRRQKEETNRRLKEEKSRKQADLKRNEQLENQRKEEEKRQAEENQRRALENKRKEQERIEQVKRVEVYTGKLEDARITLLRRFLKAVEDGQRDLLDRFSADVRRQNPLPSAPAEEEKVAWNRFEHLSTGLLFEYAAMREMMQFIQDERLIKSVQFEPKRGDFWQFTGVDAENQEFTFYSVIEDKFVRLPYSDKLVSEKLLPALKRRNKDANAEFRLFLLGRNFANITPYLPKNSFWSDNWKVLLLDYIRDSYRTNQEKTKKLYSDTPEYNQVKETEKQ